MNPRTFITAVAATLFASPVLAQTGTPLVDQRQGNQEQRIQQGVQSGQLNAREAARLEKGQEKVQKLEAAAESDGKVTKKERAALHRAQNEQSRRIAKQKHDKQRGKKAKAPGSGG